jgi:hypothetical protein
LVGGTPADRSAFAHRLRVLCEPLVAAGWRPVPTALMGDRLYSVCEFGPDGRGMPALFARGNRYLEATAFEHGGLRIEGPLGPIDGVPADPDLPVDAIPTPASIGAAELAEPGQPRRFFVEHGLLP